MIKYFQILSLLMSFGISAYGNDRDRIVTDIYEGKKKEIKLYCDRRIQIDRAEYSIDLFANQALDNAEYYISGKCIEVGKDELLMFPSDVELFDVNKNKIEHERGSFTPVKYSEEVYFASKNRKQFQCRHLKKYYISSKVITIRKGTGLLIPLDCILLNSRNEVIYHNGYYVNATNKKKERLRVACIEKKNVKLSIVPTVKTRKDYILTEGHYSNCIIECEGLNIHVGQKRIFDNVVLVGSLKNENITVEWFGCNVNKIAEDNTILLERNIIPSAIACSTNIFHSENGIYRVGPQYPIYNRQWGFDHNYLKDFNDITIKGNGEGTIIMGCDITNGNVCDVFNIVDCKNLTISDITVTVQEKLKPRTTGINAFSLIHSNVNITIERCHVLNMPYVEGVTYPDGGKAFTIQCGPNTEQNSISILSNKAENVSYGLDYTKTTYSDGYVPNNVLFTGNEIESAIAGVVIHEWNSPYQEGIEPIVVSNNKLSNCQVGIVCQTTKACNIANNTITNTAYPQRLQYYNGVYGILISGAYNTTIIQNEINLTYCDNYIKVGAYSYYPRFNGSVKNITIEGNRIKGNSKGKGLMIGKDEMTREESRMLEDVRISDNIIHQTR